MSYIESTCSLNKLSTINEFGSFIDEVVHVLNDQGACKTPLFILKTDADVDKCSWVLYNIT